jgi:hypothetical protein
MINHFQVSTMYGMDGISEKMEQLHITAKDIISVETTLCHYRVWYCVPQDSE